MFCEWQKKGKILMNMSKDIQIFRTNTIFKNNKNSSDMRCKPSRELNLHIKTSVETSSSRNS